MHRNLSQEELTGILSAYYLSGQSRFEEYKRFLISRTSIDFGESNNKMETLVTNLIAANVARDLLAGVEVNHPVTKEDILGLVDAIITEALAEVETQPDEEDMSQMRNTLVTILTGVNDQILSGLAPGKWDNERYWKLIDLICDMADKNGSKPDNPHFLGFIYDEIIRQTNTKQEYLDGATNALVGLLDEEKIFETTLKPMMDLLESQTRKEYAGLDFTPEEADALIAEKRREVDEEVRPQIAQVFAKIREIAIEWAVMEADRIFGK